MAWDAIVGQELVKRIWRTHLSAGTVANAYLLVGPDGVGKRRLALELAKTLNCLAQDEQQRPCEVCSTCSQITRQIHPDVHTISPSGASNQIKIEDIRQLISRLALRPFNARLQVAIIDGADRFTEEAANSLLKVLEEPPTYSRFVLTTSQLVHCLPTIVSRCQLLHCQPLSAEAVRRMLIESHSIEPNVAQTVAQLCGGSAAHALELAGRWAEYQQTLARFANDDASAWLTRPLAETRQDVIHVLDGMLSWLRDLVVVASGSPDRVAHAAYAESLRQQAGAVDLDRCLDTALELVGLRESAEQFVSPRLVAALAREKWLSLISDL